jgi:drug/metabolite transporter (DMT)-like permease
MEPDVGLTVDQDRAGGRPRPSQLVRTMEIAGLVLVILGLGDGRLWLAVLGAALIVASYAIYRRKHGAGRASGGGSDGPDSNDGGGGD